MEHPVDGHNFSQEVIFIGPFEDTDVIYENLSLAFQLVVWVVAYFLLLTVMEDMYGHYDFWYKSANLARSDSYRSTTWICSTLSIF